MEAWIAYIVMVAFAVLTAIVAFLGGALKRGED